MLSADRVEELFAELGRRRAVRPLEFFDPLPGQLAFWHLDGRRSVLRAGNQAKGKTTAGAILAIGYMMGVHPVTGATMPFVPPVRGWAIGLNHEQLQVLQRKVWEVVPRDMVADGCYFDERKGAFKGKYPTLRLVNGSTMRFLIGGGDTGAKASDTLHFVWVDEPPESPRLMMELDRRLMRMNGYLFMTFTPVNRPVGSAFVRAEVEAGRFAEVHDPLTPESMVHTRSGLAMRLGDGRAADAAWIAEQRAGLLAQESGVLLDGDWEFAATERTFSAWDDGAMVRAETDDREWEAWVGIDHGVGAGGNACAVLAAIAWVDGDPVVMVIDEYVSPGRTSQRQDAQAILAMVRRNVHGGWSALAGAWGDIPVGDRADAANRKSNRQLLLELARLMGVAHPEPVIRTAKRALAAGSVWLGTRFLHDCMCRAGGFSVNPRCVKVRESLNKWKGRDDEHKHILDALRYSLTDAIRQYGAGGEAPAYRVRLR